MQHAAIHGFWRLAKTLLRRAVRDLGGKKTFDLDPATASLMALVDALVGKYHPGGAPEKEEAVMLRGLPPEDPMPDGLDDEVVEDLLARMKPRSYRTWWHRVASSRQ